MFGHWEHRARATNTPAARSSRAAEGPSTTTKVLSATAHGARHLELFSAPPREIAVPKSNSGSRGGRGDAEPAHGFSAGPTKTLKAWMERDGARALRARPGE